MSDPRGLDPQWPDPARRYNDLLGGKDNFAADRASSAEIAKVFPTVRVAARENRSFLLRAVRYLAADKGIRQFLDIGAGMPMSSGVHEIAQQVDPAARVLYVDHSELVAAHIRALAVSTEEGITAFLDGDLRQPQQILTSPELTSTLDMSRPVALILAAVLHFCTDKDDPYTAVRAMIEALPSGSYVVCSHATFDPVDDRVRRRLAKLVDSGLHGPFQARSRDEVAKFLDGLELEPPGLVSTIAWQPEHDPPAMGEEHEAVSYAAVGRVP
ncbi:SAM-dependent methyltransferase [Paractinoplanes hotanensis]|uniref:SAM-dependent methyltransferase n=1 Tax=Paractinoplanes hotanensis TaxID=2906497 RepID=A0ABT0YGK6_9ACTN|nr:SAM-dependent methyltransferase [Actinoplanes hotanensis]MCM4085183.1 SAM-dependent methyltransferase [Actinoplanes hotanensis]